MLPFAQGFCTSTWFTGGTAHREDPSAMAAVVPVHRVSQHCPLLQAEEQVGGKPPPRPMAQPAWK